MKEKKLMMNVKRYFRSLYMKVAKAEGTPESIAKGVAIGLCCGLIIPIGLQTVPALVLAVIFKANKFLSWTFTCVTNPASVFFIYPVQCWVGSYLIFRPLTFSRLQKDLEALATIETFADAFAVFQTMSWSIIIPFFVGGIFFAVISAVPGYWLSLKLAQKYQERKERKRLRRLQAKQNNQ